jgi:hypothetical protein
MVPAHLCIGDPLEASPVGAASKDERSREKPLVVGAVKSNIGHLEGTSGIAWLITGVLALEQGVISPNKSFEKVNPKMAPKWNLKFHTEPVLWPPEGIRRAPVNSFGYDGTNAHAILDDAYHYLVFHNLTGKHNTVTQPRLSAYCGDGINGKIDENKQVEEAKRATETEVIKGSLENGFSSHGAVNNSKHKPERTFIFSSND